MTIYSGKAKVGQDYLTMIIVPENGDFLLHFQKEVPSIEIELPTILEVFGIENKSIEMDYKKAKISREENKCVLRLSGFTAVGIDTLQKVSARLTISMKKKDDWDFKKRK